MVKIFTVHGTNAGAESSYGDQWWQLDSDFQRKLADRIEEDLEFVPYHWSGNNSETDRRAVGGELADDLDELDEPPIIIGHSHGGSVALHAALILFLKHKEKASNYFRSLITVGTPMIRYRSALNPMFRFNIIGQLFLIYAVMIGLLVTGAIVVDGAVTEIERIVGKSLLGPPDSYGEDGPIWTVARQLLTPAVIFSVLLPALVLTIFTRRSSKRNGLFRKNTLYDAMKAIYAPVNHAQDEAIAALRSGVGVKVNLIDRKTVRAGIFAPLALALAGVGVARTVSEQVNIDALGKGGKISQAEMASLDYDELPAELGGGEASLALRDVDQRLRYLAGGLRRNVNTAQAIRNGLTRQTVYLRDDYVVMDLGQALQAPSKDDLLFELRLLSPTARSSYVAIAPGACASYALYVTEAGREALIKHVEDNITDDMFGVPEAGDPKLQPLRRALRRGGAGEADDAARCNTAPMAVAQPAALAVANLISPESLLAVASEALVSARPPLTIEVEDSSGVLWDLSDPNNTGRYPALEEGAAVIFERSAFNDAQFACAIGNSSDFIGQFTPWSREPSSREKALRGLCAQVEGKDFTFYDFSTTLLDEVYDTLDAGVSGVRNQIGRIANLPIGAPAEDDDTFRENAIQVGLLSPFYFVMSVVIVAWIFASLSAFLLAPLLSGIFNGVIKKGIFGNDGHGETVKAVAPGLDFDAKMTGTLPPEVEKDLVEYVQQYAPETIGRVRELITLHVSGDNATLPVTELSEALTWRELIHTAYFDVDSFADHMADVLVEKAGLTRKTPSA